MRYCPNCSNLLYPSPQGNTILGYSCRVCGVVETIDKQNYLKSDSGKFCVMTKQFTKEIKEEKIVEFQRINKNKYLEEDCAFPREVVECPGCMTTQNSLKIRSKGKGIQSLRFIHKCLNTECNHAWGN